MKLDTATIANLARRAGFTGTDLHVAVALALASSGGLTHYQHTSGMPGTGDWRGLWAIDVDRQPLVADRDLFDPQTAAQAAYALTTAHDGFGWSPVYLAGTWHAHEAHAAGESSKPLYEQPAVQPMTVPSRVAQYHDRSDHVTRLRDMIGRAPHRKG